MIEESILPLINKDEIIDNNLLKKQQTNSDDIKLTKELIKSTSSNSIKLESEKEAENLLIKEEEEVEVIQEIKNNNNNNNNNSSTIITTINKLPSLIQNTTNNSNNSINLTSITKNDPSTLIPPTPPMNPTTTSTTSTTTTNNNTNESITLTQLKAFTQSFPKTKQSMYTFPSPPPDSSDLMTELEEFWSYLEVGQVIEHKDAFNDDWPHHSEFIKCSKELQFEYIHQLLGGLSSTEASIRFTNARHLLYIAQGTFQSSTSPEHHLHLILSNITLLRSSGGLIKIFEATKQAGNRWDQFSISVDSEVQLQQSSTGSLGGNTRQQGLDEANAEIAILLAILYLMVEVLRGDANWAEELMNLEPPMPVYFFTVVAGMREKSNKGYPIKKMLLLFWKSILATLGGSKDVTRVKVFVREVEGLPADERRKGRDNKPDTKVAPQDYQSFRNEITSKYPSYQPPPIPYGDLDRLSAAAAPLPVKPSFSYHINANHQDSFSSSPLLPGQQQPGTPAPTPPPSPAPKPKKQQFQTDQTKPFILPFSPANAGPSKYQPRVVPQSIAEAGELYEKNMRVNVELWQTFKLREEFMADESGILRAEVMAASVGMGNGELGSTSGIGSGASIKGGIKGKGKGKEELRDDASKLSRRMEAMSMNDEEDEESDEVEDRMDPLIMLKLIEKNMRKEELEEKDEKIRRGLSQRREDVQRLQRIEVLYRSVLPLLQSSVIVLLKLLLATVSANNAPMGANGQGDNGGNEEIIELNLEDTDVMRHREVTSKAISAILILSLKWFKTSHVMKFHYLSQLLVDSNCLLLILKMFGLQEVSTSVRTKHDRPDNNFFKFVNDQINPSSSSPPRPEDAMLEAKPPGARPTSPKGTEDDEIELITEYSWRNFFSVINFVHILQKLTKRKTHRVLLLVQYKSSAILKRILKVCHPSLQLYVLKVIKSQVPYCGRKWRQANMKVITAIYLHCRPDLRDEWLTGVDIDSDVEESLPHEQALRALVKFFNTKHYGSFAPLLHRRSSAQNHAPEFGQLPPASPGGSGDNDVFPPRRSMSTVEPDRNLRYSSPGSSNSHQENLDDIGEFEIEDLLTPRTDADGEFETDPLATKAAWDRLGLLMGEYDDISDSESVGSLNFLGFNDDSSDGSVSELDIDELDEKNRKEWEQLSPETMSALEAEKAATSPRSPRPRRSSTGPISPALRPVLIDREDYGMVNESESGPIAAEPHSGPNIDEVEVLWGE